MKNSTKFPSAQRILVGLAALVVVTLFTDWLREIQIRHSNEAEIADIAALEPESARIFRAFIVETEQSTGWKVCINSGLRSPEKQALLKKMNPKNASPERSKHVRGKAIDLSLYKKHAIGRSWLRKADSKKRWRQTGIVEIAEKHRLKWGGEFRTYHDPVHFEVLDF